MKYVELTIEIPEKSIETLTNILDEMGYPEVLINDPDEVKSLIDNAGPTDYVNEEELYDVMLNPSVTLYIECADSVMDATEKAFDIIDKLRKSTLNIFSTGVEVRSDDEWKDNWKEYYRPAKVTDRIVVGPVEEVFGDSVTGSGDADDGPGDAVDGSDEPEVTGTPEGAIRIGIDPGMAFGTGIHETTTLSLKLLEKYIKGGEKVLDAGCGTGILSIAAVKLGAAKALAVDIDEEAVRSAARNIEINGVSDKITVALEDVKEGVYEENAGTAQGGEKKLYDADIVVANLISGLIIELAKDFRKYLEPGGIFIASGILESQGSDVASKLEESGFDVIDNLSDGEWTAFAARAK